MSNGKSVSAPPHYSQPVRALLSGISTGLRAHWGSNEERAEGRKHVMTRQLDAGQPSIFSIISPSTCGVYRIANLAGVISDTLLNRACIDECLEFSQTRLGQIATDNPVACARYLCANFNYSSFRPCAILTFCSRIRLTL